jgi:nucleoside 2-deoxyribosyltransferase
MTIYLAGPLFSHAEQAWHRMVQKRIITETNHDALWPFDIFSQEEISSWGPDAPRRVMEGCRDALAGCDLVVALLDGAQVDDGTAWEIGYAHAKGMPVIGVRTDFRQAGDVPGAVVNAMIHASCREIVRNVGELVERLK